MKASEADSSTRRLWYEKQGRGLSVDFAELVQAVFHRISEMPELHAEVYRHIRKAQVRKFP